MLTNKEIKIVEEEYQKGKEWLRKDYYCPHTTNPLQTKSCCKLCVLSGNALMRKRIEKVPYPFGFAMVTRGD